MDLNEEIMKIRDELVDNKPLDWSMLVNKALKMSEKDAEVYCRYIRKHRPDGGTVTIWSTDMKEYPHLVWMLLSNTLSVRGIFSDQDAKRIAPHTEYMTTLNLISGSMHKIRKSEDFMPNIKSIYVGKNYKIRLNGNDTKIPVNLEGVTHLSLNTMVIWSDICAIYIKNPMPNLHCVTMGRQLESLKSLKSKSVEQIHIRYKNSYESMYAELCDALHKTRTPALTDLFIHAKSHQNSDAYKKLKRRFKVHVMV